MGMRQEVSSACGELITQLLQALVRSSAASLDNTGPISSTTATTTAIAAPKSCAQLLLSTLTHTDRAFPHQALPLLPGDALTVLNSAVQLLLMPSTRPASVQQQISGVAAAVLLAVEQESAADTIGTTAGSRNGNLDRKVLVLMTQLVKVVMPDLSAAASASAASAASGGGGSSGTVAFQVAVPDGNDVEADSAGTVAMLTRIVGWSCGALHGAVAQMTSSGSEGE